MQSNFEKIIRENDIKLVIFDIDGTIKDLYTEHKNALVQTMKKLQVYSTKRAKFALFLNSIGMKFFKWGCLPTNCLMQSVLIWIISFIIGCDYTQFKKMYYENYPEKSILFEKMKGQIKSLPFHMDIILASTNNYNLNTQKELCHIFGIKELRAKKYKDILQKGNVPVNNILVVGDNFFDDYLPAKLLGCKVCMVNMYDSKFKAFFLNLL